MNITEMLGINIPAEHVYRFTNWINDDYQLFLDILRNDQSYNLIARMNSGKTYSFIKTAAENRIKMVIAFPLLINVIQQAKKLKEEQNITIGVIHGKSEDKDGKQISEGTSYEEIEAILANPDISVISVVYDSLSKLLSISSFDPARYVLVIDEAHNLVTQYKFRNKAINRLIEAKPRFRKVINLSGTPEGTLYFNAYKTIEFRKTVADSRPVDLKIVTYHGETLFKVLNHVLNYSGNGRVVVIKDDINFLEKLKTALIGYGIKAEKISMLSRFEKMTEVFTHLVHREEILANVKYVLTTRVISDGANIFDEDVDRVYILDSTDYWMKRQIISRFRHGVGEVLDFVHYSAEPPKSSEELASIRLSNFYDLNEKFKELLDLKTEELGVKQKQLSHYEKSGHYNRQPITGKTEDYFDVEENIIYTVNESELRISKEAIAYLHIQRINRKLAYNPGTALEFYQNIAGYNTRILSFEELTALNGYTEIVDRTQFQRLLSGEEYVENIPSFFDENAGKIFTAYCYANKKLHILLDNNLDKEFIYQGDDYTNYYESHRSFYQNKRVIMALNLASVGYPKEFISLLLKLSFDSKDSSVLNLLKMLNSYFRYSILSYYPSLSDYVMQYDGLKDYRVSAFLRDNISLGIRIDYTAFKDSVVEFARSQGIKVPDRIKGSFVKPILSGIVEFEPIRGSSDIKDVKPVRYQSLKTILNGFFKKMRADNESGIPIGLRPDTEERLSLVQFMQLRRQILLIEKANTEAGDTTPPELLRILASTDEELKSEADYKAELYDEIMDDDEYLAADEYYPEEDSGDMNDLSFGQGDVFPFS